MKIIDETNAEGVAADAIRHQVDFAGKAIIDMAALSQHYHAKGLRGLILMIDTYPWYFVLSDRVPDLPWGHPDMRENAIGHVNRYRGETEFVLVTVTPERDVLIGTFSVLDQTGMAISA